VPLLPAAEARFLGIGTRRSYLLMKKTIMLTLLVVLTSAVYAFGSACPTTGYNVYNTAGFSCGIDDKTFFNFSYSTAGTTPMPSSSITVNPITTFHNPGFLFNAPWGVTPDLCTAFEELKRL